MGLAVTGTGNWELGRGPQRQLKGPQRPKKGRQIREDHRGTIDGLGGSIAFFLLENRIFFQCSLSIAKYLPSNIPAKMLISAYSHGRQKYRMVPKWL